MALSSEHSKPLDQSLDESKLQAAVPPQVNHSSNNYHHQQPQLLNHERDVSSSNFGPPHSENQRQDIPSNPSSQLWSVTNGIQDELEKHSSRIRSKVNSWDVLPPQQLATLAVISSLGAQPVAGGDAQPQPRCEEQKEGALANYPARKTQ